MRREHRQTDVIANAPTPTGVRRECRASTAAAPAGAWCSRTASVVPGRRVAGDRAAQHVREALTSARKAEAPGAQEQKGEQPAEKEMERKFPRHGQVGGHDHAQQKRG